VNTHKIRKIIKDKILCNEILENYSNIKVPETWVFRTPKKLKEILENSGLEKLIIKPVFGKQGEGIEMIDKNTDFDKLKLGYKTWMAQEYIPVEKVNGDNWDLRIFIVDGKYAGAVTRLSSTIATNVHLGGRVEKLDKNLNEEEIGKVAEECVKTFEDYFLQN
jgi:glutathione synthase/RimK-type ligase-like ATP-grasp enzyme